MATGFAIGTDAGFSEFFHEHYASLVLFAYRLTEDQAAAEDIAEEAFIRLWHKRGDFSEIRSLKSYLYTIARNESISWLRKYKLENARYREIFSNQEALDRTMLDTMIYTESMAKIYAVIDTLPAQCRNVLVKLYIEGKKLSEISIEMKISLNTVKTHKHRGIGALKKVLTGLYFISVFVAG